jgi:hypothetical protein
MPKVKYTVTEFTPTANQTGMSHSFNAKVVINSDIDGDTLAERVAKRSGFKEYEAKAIMAAFAEIIQEETLESNRVSLCNTKGEKVVSIYPRVSGSISDKDVQSNPQKYEGRQKALEADLTTDMLTITLAATIGVNASRTFAENASIQKVSASVASVADEDEGASGGQQNGGQGTTDNSQQSGDNTGNTGDNTGDNQGGNGGGGADPDDPENSED